jgi:glycosyltransferase involved in cell wall biosynthesis
MSSCTIIICTRNRADRLRRTLAAIAALPVPADLEAEIVVADNGSTDDTQAVVRTFGGGRIPVRHVFEPKPGQCQARNTGIAQSTGEVIVFTDDDVIPPAGWLEAMVLPIVSGDADAVAGGVAIPAHLQRPWMTGLHRSMLASTERLDPNHPSEMVGANMAFSRAVLQKVPRFDTELGPGAMGFGDETLFSWQLVRAGFRLKGALDVAVEHHFDPDRLSRASFLNAARLHGRSNGYLKYHWAGEPYEPIRQRLYLLKRSLRLLYRRVRDRGQTLAPEGAPEWELRLLIDIWSLRQFLTETRRPCKYRVDSAAHTVQGTQGLPPT